MSARRQLSLLWGLLAVTYCVPQRAWAYDLPPAGEPISVAATRFNHSRTSHYSSPQQNPNPDVPAEWALVYDPRPKWSVIAIETSMIPGTQDEFLFVYKSNPVRLKHRDDAAAVLDLSEASLAGTLGDPDAPMGVQRNITVDSNPWCGHLTPMHDGRILVVGGSDATPNNHTNGLKDIRIYDYRKNPRRMPTVAQCRDGRWYPSLTLMPDHTVLIQGGTVEVGETVPASNWLERWDPAEPEAMPITSYPINRSFLRAVDKNYFPLQMLLPTGDVFILSDDQIRFLTASGTYREVAGVPAFPDPEFVNQWPRSGSLVLGALDAANDYTEVTIFIMGGVPRSNTCFYRAPDNRVLASRTIWSLRMRFSGSGTPRYTFPDGEWTTEDMGIPRTGGDAVMTPSGDVVLLGGMQRGCHGGQGRNFRNRPATIEPRNSAPAFWPILYQPNGPEGRRVTVMAGSSIARAYHHTAALTLDGYILVAGCDECNASSYFQDGVDALARDFWSPLPRAQGKREHRVEIFKTPFSLDANNRPKIVTMGDNDDRTGVVTSTFGDVLTITWTADVGVVDLPDVTGVSLVAPSATTHSYNNNQRVLKLEIVSKDVTGDTGTVTVRMPPNARVAPPQFYQVYLLNRKTNSRAWWLHLQS